MGTSELEQRVCQDRMSESLVGRTRCVSRALHKNYMRA